jgi:hypothetical protein
MWFLHLILASTDTLDQIEVSKDLFGKNGSYIRGGLNFIHDHCSFIISYYIENLDVFNHA